MHSVSIGFVTLQSADSQHHYYQLSSRMTASLGQDEIAEKNVFEKRRKKNILLHQNATNVMYSFYKLKLLALFKFSF